LRQPRLKIALAQIEQTVFAEERIGRRRENGGEIFIIGQQPLAQIGGVGVGFVERRRAHQNQYVVLDLRKRVAQFGGALLERQRWIEHGAGVGVHLEMGRGVIAGCARRQQNRQRQGRPCAARELRPRRQ